MNKPVDTEKRVPEGFFLTSNVHKSHFRPGLCSGPLWVSLWRLYMLIKVPVRCNLVLFIYHLYGPWKSLKLILTNGQEPWLLVWHMSNHSVLIYHTQVQRLFSVWTLINQLDLVSPDFPSLFMCILFMSSLTHHHTKSLGRPVLSSFVVIQCLMQSLSCYMFSR